MRKGKHSRGTLRTHLNANIFNNYEIIDQNRYIPTYDDFFPPPDMSDTDSSMSNVSTPKHISLPSLLLPPNKSETDDGTSLDEYLLFLDIKKLRIKEV